MKRLIPLLILLAWCVPVHASTWTMVQHTQKAASCASPCTFTITATTAGDLLVGIAHFGTTGATVTSINGGTSVHPAGCAGSRTNAATDLAYVLSATGGTTSFTITASATLASGEMLEYSNPNGALFDVCNNRNQASGANAAGVSAGTLTGTNDVILQWAYGVTNPFNSPTCPNSGTNPNDFPTGNAVCGLINSTNNAAGNYSNSSTAASFSAAAFKEGAVVTITSFLPMPGVEYMLIGVIIGIVFVFTGAINVPISKECPLDYARSRIGMLAGNYHASYQLALGSPLLEMQRMADGTYQAEQIRPHAIA